MVDEGEITLEELREEITKHLGSKTNVVPNSLAQLLIGCVGDSNACLMKAEKPYFKLRVQYPQLNFSVEINST